MFDFEERELMSSILLPDCSGLPIARELAIEPPPTFPFLESQCQRAAFEREFFILPETKHRPQGVAQRAARRGV